MKATGIAHLKARLSSYLKIVKAGNEVLITDRGIPIAKLVPIDAGGKDEARIQKLVAEGLLTLPKGRLPRELLEPLKGDLRQGKGVLAALLAERDEGR
jgi:prevent-host-death family protein